MRARKGFIFTADAIFAFYLITIMLSVLLLLSYSPKIYTEQSQTLAKDILTVMNNIKIGDLANDARFPFSESLVYVKRNSVPSCSMFLQTPEHNNSVVSTYPTSATILWNSGPGLHNGGSGFTVDSSPIVYNGKAIITSKTGTYLIDENTGYQFWNMPIPAISTPAVSNGRLFIGSTDCVFYSIDESGNVVWNQTLSDQIISSPVVHNGNVFFGSMNHNIYALNQNTGNVTWFFTTGGNISSSPAVSDNKVFVFSNDGILYALNENTFGLLWYYNTTHPYPVRTDVPFDPSPSVANGIVYFSNGNTFYAVNISNGSLMWSQAPLAAGQQFTSSPVIDNGTVYVGYSNGIITFNATTGTSIDRPITGGIISTPLIANDSIITASGSGRIAVNYKSNWSTIWSYDTGVIVFSSPALVNGRIYVTTANGNLYVFGNCSLWDENMSAIDTISAFWLISQNSLNANASRCAQALGKEMLDSTVPSNYGSELVIKSAGMAGLNCSGRRSASGEDSIYTDDCNKTKYQRILIQDSRYISGVVQKGSTVYYAKNPLQFELRIWN